MKIFIFASLLVAMAPLQAMREAHSVNQISRHIKKGDCAGASKLIKSNPELLLPENWGNHCPWYCALQEGFYNLVYRMIEVCAFRGYDLKKIIVSPCTEPYFGAKSPLLNNVVEQSSRDVITAKMNNHYDRMQAQISSHPEGTIRSLAHADPIRAIQWIVEDFIARMVSLAPEVVQQVSQGSLETALHVAAREGSYHAMELILMAGGLPNCQNCIGETPLHLCVAEKRPVEFIELLRSYGAFSCLLKNKRGLTPLQCAQHLENDEHVEALRSQDVNSTLHCPAYMRILRSLDQENTHVEKN